MPVDTFARWRARPGADFVQDIVVAKGKDLIVRGIYLIARHSLLAILAKDDTDTSVTV